MNCTRKGCDRPAAFVPKICVPAMGRAIGAHRPLEVGLTLPTCAECMAGLTRDNFISPDHPAGAHLRHVIGLAAGGRVLPDFDRAWVEGVALDGVEFAEIERATSGATTQ